MGKGQEHPGGANVAQQYSFAEVTAMTNNFKQTLGVGSFGTVCYGKLPDGQEVAVKRASPNSQQGAKEFYNEVIYYLTPVICMFISLSHSLILIVDLNILNPKIQLIHSKLELNQSKKNLILPQVTTSAEFHHQKKKCYACGKGYFWKN